MDSLLQTLGALNHASDALDELNTTWEISRLAAHDRRARRRLQGFRRVIGAPRRASRDKTRSALNQLRQRPALVAGDFGQPQWLSLGRVILNSPGFWEFVGGLNPLEQIRIYLSERHERKKDNEYRNDAECRRLHAEAVIREAEARIAQADAAERVFDVVSKLLGADEARRAAADALFRLGEELDRSEALGPVPELIRDEEPSSDEP